MTIFLVVVFVTSFVNFTIATNTHPAQDSVKQHISEQHIVDQDK